MNHKLQGISYYLSEKPELCGLHIMFTSVMTSYTHTCACRQLRICL